MYGDFPAKNTACTPYIPMNVWSWPTLHICACTASPLPPTTCTCPARAMYTVYTYNCIVLANPTYLCMHASPLPPTTCTCPARACTSLSISTHATLLYVQVSSNASSRFLPASSSSSFQNKRTRTLHSNTTSSPTCQGNQ